MYDGYHTPTRIETKSRLSKRFDSCESMPKEMTIEEKLAALNSNITSKYDGVLVPSCNISKHEDNNLCYPLKYVSKKGLNKNISNLSKYSVPNYTHAT